MKSAMEEHPGPAVFIDESGESECAVFPDWEFGSCPQGHNHVERRSLGGGAYYLECVICWTRSGTLMDRENVPKTMGVWDMTD